VLIGGPGIQNYNIFVDEISATSYQIALIPATHNGAMATKAYSAKEDFISDLQRVLGYTDRAVERFFAAEDRHHTLLQHALSDEDAAYLGWVPVLNVA
jgi:hypothetical protein